MTLAHASPLRLLAQNTEDFHILAGLLQGALLLARSIRWSKATTRFSMRLDRFCWEVEAKERENWRTESELSLIHVVRATHKGLTRANPEDDQPLTLLSCDCVRGSSLIFKFSEGAVLSLSTGSASQGLPHACLTDIGEKFLAPSG